MVKKMQNNMFLIIEETVFVKNNELQIYEEIDPAAFLNESVSHDALYPKIKFKSILQSDIGQKNGNRRIYPFAVGKSIAETLNKKATARRELLMEIDHPMNCGEGNAAKNRAMTVSLKNSGSLINKVWLENNNIYGDLETLTGFRGPDLYKSIAIDKLDIGFSLRMFGGLKKSKLDSSLMEVTFPINPITVDVVLNPSHANSRIMSIMTESDNLSYLLNLNENNSETNNKNVDFDFNENDLQIIQENQLDIGNIENKKDFNKYLNENIMDTFKKMKSIQINI